MFKNIILTAICFITFSYSSKGQFTLDHDSVKIYGEKNEFDLIAHTKIRNLSNKPDTIVWTRIINILPSNWTSAVCDINQCYASTVSSAEFILDSGKVGDLSMHFYPANYSGKARMIVRFARKSNPFVYKEIIINCTTNDLGLNSINYTSLKIAPNPALNFITIGDGSLTEGTYEIFSLIGEKVLSNHFVGSQKIDITTLRTGIYTIAVRNGNSIASSKLVIE